MTRWLAVASLFAALMLPAGHAHAVCDVIPGTQGAFRGALGVVDRPFARPGDPVELRLDPRVTARPPGFSRRCVRPRGDGALPAARRTTDRRRARARTASGSRPHGIAARPSSAAARRRAFPPATRSRSWSATAVRRLRVRFPDTDALLATPGDPASAADGRTLAGPAAIAVTRPGDDLPCGLATGRCRDTVGLVACVDELYLEDGACDDVLHPDFGFFTALPPANDFGAVCTEPSRHASGSWRTSRSVSRSIAPGTCSCRWTGAACWCAGPTCPVARLLRGTVTLEAFAGSRAPLRLEDDSLLGSYSLSGTRLPPIFTPQSDPEGERCA